MFKSQGGKFSLGQAKIKEIKKLLANREVSSKKAFKILFDCLPLHLLSGREITSLLQLIETAENNFQSNY